MKERGFALATVLVLSVAVFVMGLAGMFISEMGFRSISAEARWHMAEKAANAGLEQTAGDIVRGVFQCGNNRTINLNGVTVQVNTINAGGSCFVWASATMGNTRVVKVGVLTAGNPAGDFGALVMRRINNLNLGGSGAITSCDPDCRTSAVVIGNNLSNPPAENQVTTCPNNPRGVTALVDPLVVSPELSDKDITNTVFNNINDRDQLLTELSNRFRVRFNNGTPSGINGTYTQITDSNGGLLISAINITNPPLYDVCDARYNNCTASGNTITCTGNTNLRFVWSNGVYLVQPTANINLGGVTISAGTTVARCNAIDFGPNAIINVNNFNGGGPIAGNQINLNGNASNATFIARNITQDNSNNITMTNVNIFSQNIRLDNNGLKWEGGVLYSGGAGVGNFDIDLKSNSYLGSATNPVLLITDNNMNIQRNGTASINGLVFATSASNNLNIGAGNGNFEINGAVVSNSTRNNNINISGNFEINFNARILNELARRYNFLRPPQCNAQVSVRIPYIQTKATTY